jgi:hypothetical protein
MFHRWVLAVDRVTAVHHARSAECRVSQACSRTHSSAPSKHCSWVGLTGSWAAQSGSPASARQAVRCIGWVVKATVGLGPVPSFGPVAREFKKFLFFFGSVWIVSNFKNSYLFAQSSKNYEISFVGFLIL